MFLTEYSIKGIFQPWKPPPRTSSATGTFALADSDADAVTISVERLEQLGVALGYPHSSEIRGSAYALRELRIAAEDVVGPQCANALDDVGA